MLPSCNNKPNIGGTNTGGKISILQIGLLAQRYKYRSWKSDDPCYAIANVTSFLPSMAWKADPMFEKT